MALRCLRLRRTLTSLFPLRYSISPPTAKSPLSPQLHASPPSRPLQSPFPSQSRAFTGSRFSLARNYKLYKEGDEITEDTVLFAGCDYNHWLITMDFPKDPKPTPEEMVSTYERTCAQGLNISIEEAKKRIYACSTTTYNGFQAVMTEEESEKFKDVPGVVFVLPDSYIDPVNEQYGGDKYENGVITPRPPPVQYQRNRNREPRYNRQGGRMPNHQGNQQYNQQGNPQYNQQVNPQYNQQGNPQYNQQGNLQYNQQGSVHGSQMPNQLGSPLNNQQGYMRGGRNSGPPQDYSPQQNYGPPGQGESMPMNNRDYAPGGREAHQANRGPLPSHQINNNQWQQGNNYPQYQRDAWQGQQGNNYPQYQRGDASGGQQGNNYPQYQRDASPGGWENYGSPGQGSLTGNNANLRAGNYGQGPNTGHGQGYPNDGERFSQDRQK